MSEADEIALALVQDDLDKALLFLDMALNQWAGWYDESRGGEPPDVAYIEIRGWLRSKRHD